MSYNPYAPPAAESAVRADVPARGEPQPWDVGEALRSGWAIYSANWAPLTLGYLVVTVLGALPGQLTPALALAGVIDEGSTAYYAVNGSLAMLGWFIATFFTAGFTGAALRATRGEAVSFGDFFAAGGQFIPFAAMTFLKTLAIVLGMIVFIVPGIILSLGFANAPFFVIDQKLGPIASLKASWESAEGQKGNLFLLQLAEIGITFLGVLSCCLGLFVAVPLLMVARAIVYTRMSGTAAPPAPPPGGGPGWGSGPGYGPPGGPYGGAAYGSYGGGHAGGGYGTT